jgi:hypothetical protein
MADQTQEALNKNQRIDEYGDVTDAEFYRLQGAEIVLTELPIEDLHLIAEYLKSDNDKDTEKFTDLFNEAVKDLLLEY